MVYDKTISLVSGVVGIIFGIIITMLGILYYDLIMSLICIFIGSIIILFNILPLIVYAKQMTQDKRYILHFIMALCYILLGGYFIYDHGYVSSIIFGSILLIFPLIRILMAKNHFERFIQEIPLLIIGTLLFFNFSEIIFRIAFITFGISAVILGFLNIVYTMLTKKEIIKDEEIIEVEAKETE